ncbi:MAG: hypothetical protein WCO26_04885 [Deltaproteobacteria bacterium]
MKKEMGTALLRVIIDGQKFHLTMMDGSKWFVDPSDLPTVATWMPTAPIAIERNDNQMFSHDLTNLDEGVTIKAMRVRRPKNGSTGSPGNPAPREP